MGRAAELPGVTNIWTMPIINRIDMLTTGIRSEVGVKIFGTDLAVLDETARRVADVLRTVRGAGNVYPEPVTSGQYLNVHVDRARAARYGLSVAAVQEVIATAVGERNLTLTLEGRRRFPVRVRYAPEYRADAQALGNVLVIRLTGQQVPLAQLATIRRARARDDLLRKRPAARDRAARTCRAGTSAASSRKPRRRSRLACRCRRVLHRVERALGEPGTRAAAAADRGADRARDHLRAALFHLSLGARSRARAAGGAVCAHRRRLPAVALGYNFSVAVWVGFIALFGTAVQTGVVMVIYLEEALQRKVAELGGRLTRRDLRDAVVDGALLRLRPKVMTVSTVVAGLLPIMWSTASAPR